MTFFALCISSMQDLYLHCKDCTTFIIYLSKKEKSRLGSIMYTEMTAMVCDDEEMDLASYDIMLG
jgi:hypothetical protein